MMARKKTWEAVAFSDLHVSAKTLDRSLTVLRAVRAAAEEGSRDVVFLGDFWDLRSTLSVRQLDAVLKEISLWHNLNVTIIPGNHDQVTVDGSIHGTSVFSGFPFIQVATDRLLDTTKKIAYLPWREDEE